VHVLRGRPEPDRSEAEFKKYGRNRLSEGKLPACAEMCSTKALLGGDGDVISDIYRERRAPRQQGRRGLGLGQRLRRRARAWRRHRCAGTGGAKS
jgi:formate dehydrogenase iron-sulfur subunit